MWAPPVSDLSKQYAHPTTTATTPRTPTFLGLLLFARHFFLTWPRLNTRCVSISAKRKVAQSWFLRRSRSRLRSVSRTSQLSTQLSTRLHRHLRAAVSSYLASQLPSTSRVSLEDTSAAGQGAIILFGIVCALDPARLLGSTSTSTPEAQARQTTSVTKI